MSKSLDPLKTTTPALHRFYCDLYSADQWYAIMRECRSWFQNDWHTMPKTLKKFGGAHRRRQSVKIWFEVPNIQFAAWVALKMAISVTVIKD